MTAARRPRAKRGEGDRLRQEILVAASDLLLQRGSEDAVSIRAVAEAVGVTPPSIYLHFADKDELLWAVCALQFRRFDEYVEKAVGGSGDPLQRLMRRGAAYVRFGVEHPEHYRLLFMSRPGSLMRGAGQAEEISGFDHLVENVVECIEAGSISRDYEPLETAMGLWVMVHGVTSLAISVPGFPEIGMDRLMTHLSQIYTRGLAP